MFPDEIWASIFRDTNSAIVFKRLRSLNHHFYNMSLNFQIRSNDPEDSLISFPWIRLIINNGAQDRFLLANSDSY
jgi:hypothetical protein